MSKKFLTVFAVVALLVAAMAGTAFAVGLSDDVTGLAVSMDAASPNHIILDAPEAGTLDYPATVYYLDKNAFNTKGFSGILSVDFADGASDPAYVVSADGTSAAYNLVLTGTPQIGTAPATKAIELVVTSTDLTQSFTITGIGTYTAAGAISADADSASLDVKPEVFVAAFASTKALQIPPTTEKDKAFEVSLDLAEGYDFDGKLCLFVNDVNVSKDYAINNDGIVVSHDSNGKVTFVVSEDGAGGATTAPMTFEFRFDGTNAANVLTVAGAAVAGISDDATMAANKVGTFTVAVEEPTPPDEPSVTLSASKYDYVIGDAFTKAFGVTATNCEVVDVTATASGTQALADQVAVSYVSADETLVFDVATAGGKVDVPGSVYYNLEFAVSQDGVMVSDPVTLNFELNAALGYIKAAGPTAIYGAKGYAMNIAQAVTVEPAAKSADFKSAKFTVYVYDSDTPQTPLSGDKEVTWKGVRVAFDYANQKLSFSGTPTEADSSASVSVECDIAGVNTNGLSRFIDIATSASEVTSGITVDGVSTTGLALDKANNVKFPLKSGDIDMSIYTPWLQVSGPDGFVADPTITVSSIGRGDATVSNGTYVSATGIMGATITPRTAGTYYFDAFYVNTTGDLIMERASLNAGGGGYHSDSGVGCDAGFGAFALLGLAGAAALLRKKD